MQLFHILKKWYRWCLPHHCVLCRFPSKRPQDLCEACYQELPILTHSCILCSQKLSISTICGECLQHPPPFDSCFALTNYEEGIKKLILNLKFNQALINARILGELLAEKIQQQWYTNRSLPDCIIPTPLHHHRLKERGFNQSVEIARPISRLLAIPMNTASCFRIKPTKAQATLHADKRKSNVKNAFIVRGNLNNQSVAILDDVMTTGHTMRELATTIRKAGANRIDVWCCARA